MTLVQVGPNKQHINIFAGDQAYTDAGDDYIGVIAHQASPDPTGDTFVDAGADDDYIALALGATSGVSWASIGVGGGAGNDTVSANLSLFHSRHRAGGLGILLVARQRLNSAGRKHRSDHRIGR